MDLSGSRFPMKKDSLLIVQDLTKRFGGITALNRCSLELEAGQIFGLIGPNGSGKTTLFNLITGLERQDKGSVYFKGGRIDGLKPHQICQLGIGRTFQITRVFPQLTALENLLVVARKGKDGDDHGRALGLLDFVGLRGLKDEYAGNLSFGQQRLVEFVRVLMLDPELILLDEPAAGVNRTLLNQLLDRIMELQGMGKTFLIVEHDMNVIMGLCQKVFVLDHGEKIAEGEPREIQANEQVIEAYFGKRAHLKGR